MIATAVVKDHIGEMTVTSGEMTVTAGEMTVTVVAKDRLDVTIAMVGRVMTAITEETIVIIEEMIG